MTTNSALVARLWNQFFYEPKDPTVCSVMRIGLALLLLIYNLTIFRDAVLWFGESGVLPYAASRTVVDSDTISVFDWLPKNDIVPQICMVIFTMQVIFLLVGVKSKFQCFGIFIWLVSFQHRNILLYDGEDAVFRLICFLMIFLPLDARWSLERWLRKLPESLPQPLWALRLIQIEMCLIFVSTAWLKLDGKLWLNGTALHYVARLDDMFGRFPVPNFLFENLLMIQVMTWSVLAFEVLAPILIWSTRLRVWVLVALVLFHLATDYAMNLFLFHWVMLLGWLSFLDQRWINEIREALFRLRRFVFKSL